MKRFIHFRLGIVLLLLVLTGFSSLAQEKLTGKVTDENNLPLPGVIIQQQNTQNKTSSDKGGHYTISLIAGGAKALIFSYIGYQTLTIPYTGTPVISPGLKPSASDLDEVIVVGYTSQLKSSISGAVGTVNMADAEKRRVADVSQVLQGQVAGVQVTQSTGAPGDPINIRIRGEGTIGDNSPLFVVDGTPTKDISFLNPADIKTFTVLKDASSAAIYGSRAAGGVVVITTKGGVIGKSSLEVNYYTGIQRATNLPKMMNSTQYLNTVEQAWKNAGYPGVNPYTAEKTRTDLANTDWLHELFETGFSQNVQLSASGGSEKVQYLISGDYYSQDGIVKFDNDKYQRTTFRANINANITDRLRLGTNLQISYAKQDWLSSKGDAPGIIRHAFLRPPVLGVYKDPSDPTYKASDPFTDLPFYKNNNLENGGWDRNFERTSNPVALAKFANDKRSNFKTFGNVFGEYSFLKDKSLKLKSNLGVDINFLHNKRFLQNFGDDDGAAGDLDKGKGLGRQNRPNALNEERGEEMNFTWTNTLNYTKTINKHAINALVGSEFIKNSSSAISASRSRYDYTSDAFQYIDFGGITNDLWNGGNAAENSLFSLFASATYAYDSRFMLTANFRADASSRFGENNQWGYFPSVSAGWTVSREEFMKDVNWISDLKLRVSTGQLGNQQIPNYAYQTIFRKDGENYRLDRYGNPDLKWETTTQHNAGIDLGILKNKLTFSLDYFIKTTSGILLPVSLPGIVGDVQPTLINAAQVRNKGFEFAVNYSNSARAFKYNINANFATLNNKVLKLHPNLPIIENNAVSRSVVGQPLGAFYGYKMVGIYQNANEIKNYLHGTNNPTEQPGDIKFEDLDGNGIIDGNDRTFIGNPVPKFSYGMNLSASYKGFDLSILLQGVQGVDKYNDLKKIIDFDGRPFNHTTAVLDSWHGEGTSNTRPRVSFSDNGGSKVSSIFVENASYFRVKNIEIGYSFGKMLKKEKWGLQDVRVYVSGQNLYTNTKYTGLDPESIDTIDYGTYPQSRAFLLGLNVKF